MRRPAIVSYTKLALEATEYAKENGRFFVFHEALYRAYWEGGKDLGSLDVIEDAARNSGLDHEELRRLLEGRAYEERVTRDFQEAVSLGVQGIPAFLIGKYLFTGARPYEDFKAVAERVLNEESES